MTANYQHQHLPLAQVEAGMVLSDELLDMHGKVLLPQGAVLTDAMLALMPRHGITALSVVKPAESEEQAQQRKDAYAARLAHVFRHNDIDSDADWATGLLHRYLLLYRLGPPDDAATGVAP